MPKSKTIAKKTATKKAVSSSVPVYSVTGAKTGTLQLPKELFGAKINGPLLAQALRVYTNNQKGHWSNTKTRGEVSGSTRKVYKQKHTGRARHGSIKAPIYVGGGVALGPKSRVVELGLPKKMRKAALISALAQKMSEKEVFVISDLEKATGKTKQFSTFAKSVNRESILIISGEHLAMVARAVGNIGKMEFRQAETINVLDIIKHRSLVLTKNAVEKLREKLLDKSQAIL